MNYRCYQITPRVKHFYTNRERSEVLTGYLLLGHRPGGEWADTQHWTKRFTVLCPNMKQQQLRLFHVFFLIAFLQEACIRNIIFITRHYLYNNTPTNNNLWRSSRPYFTLPNPQGHAKGYLLNLWAVVACALKRFASPNLDCLLQCHVLILNLVCVLT